MGTIVCFSDESFASWPKSLYGVLFSFDHFLVCICLNAGHCLSCMDAVRLDWVAIEISHCFYWINLSFDLHLVRLHSLLYLWAYLSKSGIDSSLPDSCISSIFHSNQKIIIGGIECYSKSAIDNSPFNMSTKIDFAYVIIG